MTDITFGTFGTTVVAIGARPAHQRDAARQLEKAGFVYQPEVGLHELPADTHPLDAMLRIQYAANLLAAAGVDNLGIDPALTAVFERQARQHAARTVSSHLAQAAPGPGSPAPNPPPGGPASTRTR